MASIPPMRATASWPTNALGPPMLPRAMIATLINQPVKAETRVTRWNHEQQGAGQSWMRSVDGEGNWPVSKQR